jgi:hypothetical protein
MLCHISVMSGTARNRLRIVLTNTQASTFCLVQNARKPTPTPPREPLVLPANGRDVTAEKAGTIFAFIGATSMMKAAANASTPAPSPAPSPAPPERK